jgi:hypothetical protein
MELEVSTLFDWLRRGPVIGNFKYSNKMLGFTHYGEVLEHLRN